MDAGDHFRFSGGSGDDGFGGDGFIPEVEPEVSFAVGGVGAVAEVAIFGEDGLDVPVEGDLFFGGGGNSEEGGEEEDVEGGWHGGIFGRGGLVNYLL